MISAIGNLRKGLGNANVRTFQFPRFILNSNTGKNEIIEQHQIHT